MGVWQPKAMPMTSNWKEAMTVLQSLRQERDTDRLRHGTVFYITDNLVSCYVLNSGSSRSPRLHEVIEEIKTLTMELGCRLEIVHAPGTLMIKQGTEGLSRGVWVAPSRRPQGFNQALFEAVPYSEALGAWAASCVYSKEQPKYLDPTDLLTVDQGQGILTIWNPPPECARQTIASFLFMWVQNPQNTEGLFLVPQNLQRQWGRISRHVREVGVFHSEVLPTNCAFPSHLPFVLLHVTPHQHSLRKPRLDGNSRAPRKNWHNHQAEEVRGLS